MNNYTKDELRIRELAKQWLELSHLPIMAERKKLWGNLHSLHQTRPLTLIETPYIDNFIKPDELMCTDEYLRNLEEYMLDNIIHAKEIGDDVVIESYFRIGYSMEQPSFGVDVSIIETGESTQGAGYVFKHTIKEPKDLKKLVKRRFLVDTHKTQIRTKKLENLFGDILPIKVGNHGFMDNKDGNYMWVGNFFFGLTWQIHRFVGLDQMLYWYYDYPQAFHELMEYMTQDRLSMFKTLEESKCLLSNSDNQMAGPRFYGYCDDLPYFEGEAKLKDLWAWCESQESSSISPSMFEEFVLPYLAKLAKEFGLIYYGCCEPVYDKIDLLKKAIPNIRAISVSMWNDFDKAGELIGKDFVFSRKPAPPSMSGKEPNWDSVKKDIALTKKSAKNCCLELLFRDLYDINGDRSRLSKWVELVKNEFDY